MVFCYFKVLFPCFFLFSLQCFSSVLESSFDSQVTKEREVAMEPLAQGLQEDLVSFLLHRITTCYPQNSSHKLRLFSFASVTVKI